ncbi:hypothetical protein [Paraclostridium bifermentans]|uniref:hypothetical protein n=1 Tax=Paraclostridium bifermentans TaxID=1490 RepID=UPI002431CAA9|nr:hypothetical protein [Paraclostridium bifermentans]
MTQYLYKTFYIDEIHKSGFNVEYWDCSNISWKGISLPNTMNLQIVKKILSFEEFSKLVEEYSKYKSLFSVELRKNQTNLPFFKILSNHNCYMIRFKMFENCVLPISKLEIMHSIKTGKIISDIYSRLYKKIINKKIDKLYKAEGIKEYDLIFSSSGKCDIYINHPDYDKSLLDSNKNYNIESNYIVYLDNYFPYHPDIQLNNPNFKQININKHYIELNRIFKYIEDKYNKKIIIAAHPKANYINNPFDGRNIIKNDTQYLIKNSFMVLLHSSNAISFAIIYDKPVVYISTSQYKKAKTEYYRMRRLSCYFKQDIITNENTFKLKIVKSDELNKKYMYNFLTKPEIENKNNLDIIIPALLNIINNKI